MRKIPLIVALCLIAIAVIALALFWPKKKAIQPTVTETPPVSPAYVTEKEFADLKNEVEELKKKPTTTTGTASSDYTFVSLKDYSTTLSPEPKGRPSKAVSNPTGQ